MSGESLKTLIKAFFAVDLLFSSFSVFFFFDKTEKDVLCTGPQPSLRATSACPKNLGCTVNISGLVQLYFFSPGSFCVLSFYFKDRSGENFYDMTKLCCDFLMLSYSFIKF